jgi:hypothetical protein
LIVFVADLFYRLTVTKEGYELLLTDLVGLFFESLSGQQNILRRCQKLNPGMFVVG